MTNKPLNQTPFPEVFANSIPYMEADGTRWCDIIYAIRAVHGMDTDSRYLRIENDDTFTWDDFMHHVPTAEQMSYCLNTSLEQRDYTSDTLFRRMIFKGAIPHFMVTISLSRSEIVIVSAGESLYTNLLKITLEQVLQKPTTINSRPPVEFDRDVTLSEALNWESAQSPLKVVKAGFGG